MLNTAKGFTGQYYDALTGLDYYNARYYDPAVGVFLSADQAQGNPQGMNPYGYVSGNPETWSDPRGTYAIDEGEGGGTGFEGQVGAGDSSGSPGGVDGADTTGATTASTDATTPSSGDAFTGVPTDFAVELDAEVENIKLADEERLQAQTRAEESTTSSTTSTTENTTPEQTATQGETTSTESAQAPETNTSASSQEEKYYFRGTSRGYPGNPSLQTLGVSPASTDPAVAAVFATESEAFGEGVVYIATSGDLEGVEIGLGNFRAALESEVSVGISPLEFAESASMEVDAADARGMLRSMGIQIPEIISSAEASTRTLYSMPRLLPNQIERFIQLVRGL